MTLLHGLAGKDIWEIQMSIRNKDNNDTSSSIAPKKENGFNLIYNSKNLKFNLKSSPCPTPNCL